ncbi:type I restriction endonuclease subunit R [Veillonella magna]|uniref:type I restriction endonuclease subunit R n=1 Tax=Veillonella magna TaxID=464322 RepID=UPI0023F09C67|nr:HsdR family type I site-specific deoxyribonuclease [Veillonella magna]MBD8975149.1 type I restriction endonuclease subunit R [Veillonella magna]
MVFNDEKAFETAVIEQLVEYGWEPQVLNYPTEEELIRNWADILFNNNRQQDVLNDCPLTDSEMAQIIEQIIALRTPVRLNEFINGKSVSIKRDNVHDKQNYGKEVSLKIYDRREIAYGASRYQIVRQPKFKTAPRLNDRRGDLMLLINGMPVIHVELKKSGVPVSNAYNQIEKYSREGAFTGLFSLVQVFVAMEPSEAVYFANPGPDGVFNKSFYFHWADFDNMPYSDWQDVIKYLLNIPMAHELIGYYTIPDSKDDILKVMRSYQYRAAKAISDAVMGKDWSDTNNLGGYIWHTTGSGKTLTSFKSAHLIASARTADKVIFLVDRKALGKQSFDDYRAFASGTEEIQDTADTEVLVSKLKSDDYSDTLIITSIQKLSNVTRDADNIKAADIEKIVAKRIVIIIDEAHRSTFGEMLTNIKSTFTHAIIFGFTGTPIQEANRKKDNTTTTIFGNELHRYTLADGIRDGNVLGFDPYMEMTYSDIDLREQVALMMAKASTINEVIGDPKREKIYYKFMDQTKAKMAGEWRGEKYVKGIEDYVPNSQYTEEKHQKAVVENIIKYWTMFSRGGLFHAIFATHSIPEAVKYYKLFKTMAPHLNVTAVFDPNIDNEGGGTLEKEDGIVEILEDYEKDFGPSFSIPTYDAFREDVQLRLAHKRPYNRVPKDKQLHLLIVVNQMLTGYDSKWINTLYLDKVLEYENLIQAFSRTNRLFGDEKPFGIVKYYRRPHTMKRNIEIAVKAYSGDIPTGLFVDKLPSNLESMNRFFAEIRALFQAAGISNFERLPDEPAEKRKFAKLFKQLNQRLESALIQGFSWEKDTYATEVEGTEKYIVMEFNHNTYLTLVQRYKELSSGGGGGKSDEPPFDIDTHITEINTDAIDADYMNSRFDKFFKLWQQGTYDQGAMDQILKDLHQSFAILSQTEQRYANLVINAIQSGEVKVDPTMTFRDYITKYMRKAEDARIARLVRRLSCNETLLRKMLDRKVDGSNYKEFGYFDELVKSVDQKKAEAFFAVIEKENYKPYRLKMMITKYLKDFVVSGGIDPYADIIDSGRRHSGNLEENSNEGPSQAGSGDGNAEVDSHNIMIRTTVSRERLTQWYGKSNAVACLMNTGCFAYVEDRVCLDEEKYVERQESGKMRLTSYAKEHEEECFLQFKTDENGNLHYVKLPESIADKEFRYSDEISEDMIKQLGLINEIANEMLKAIRDLDFGDALRELMSKRICNCSVGLLRSITGLDNNTINQMWKNKSLNKVNVISACLGIHLPFPVSTEMVALASISLAMNVGSFENKAENQTYQNLLSVRWASDYSEIYDDLVREGMERLIKKPPM